MGGLNHKGSMLAKFLSDMFFRGTWVLFLLGASFLCYITFTYYLVNYEEGIVSFFRKDIGFLLAKKSFVGNIVWMTAFYFHVTSCILCLLVGPFQFVGYIRLNYTNLHRLLGKIYIFSILAAGVPSGFYMAIFANGGFAAQTGFVVLSVLWAATTYLAYHAIRKRDFKAHMGWAARSYALTFSAVTLRLWTPLLSVFTDMPHDTITGAVAWLNWIPNLLFTELLIRYFPRKL